MTNEEFKYWMSGYLALTSEDVLTVRQLIIIKNHIDLVRAVDGQLEPCIDQFQSMIISGIKSNSEINRSDLKHPDFSL